MYGYKGFQKTEGTICNVSIESTDICNIASNLANSNRLIVVKLKKEPKFKGYE